MQPSLSTFERLESEVRGYCRDFPTVFTKASGSLLYSENGQQYIDFFSGAGTLNYGHNHPGLKQALIHYLQDDGLLHGLDMATTAKRDFLETFESLILEPRGYAYKMQFTGPTGTNAVEAAFKLARKVTGRTSIMAFTNGFHGMTLGSVAATGNTRYRNAAGVPLSHVNFIPYDGYLGPEINTLDYVERLLSDPGSGIDAPAAIIVETVQGEGGVHVARCEWLQGLEVLCRKHDILLIIDDIQIGCGRSGAFFSFEAAGISPDIVTLSKSLSGMGLPMSIVLIKPELDQWLPGEHNGTFRGNNLAFVTAAEALRLFWRDDALKRDVEAKSRILQERLETLCAQYPEAQAVVRGRGMLYGLACRPPGLAARLAHIAFEKGLVIETSGATSQVVKCMPPLVIETSQLQEGLDIIEQSLPEALEQTSCLQAEPVGAME